MDENGSRTENATRKERERGMKMKKLEEIRLRKQTELTGEASRKPYAKSNDSIVFRISKSAITNLQHTHTHRGRAHCTIS